MSNYGMNMGKANTYNGKTNIKNKVTIRKGHIVISISIVLIIIVIFTLVSLFHQKENRVNITGRWINENGNYIEFLSDGTIHKNGYDSLHADTYEIMEEGYLKWGSYDTAWVTYRYTYWDININGSHLILTQRNSNTVIELTKE